MSEDIVERMRFWSKTRNDNPTAWNLDCGAAADAIARLTAERDEARLRLCKVVGDNRDMWGEDVAKEYGWDCFGQEESK
jgi:hypothetical protein